MMIIGDSALHSTRLKIPLRNSLRFKYILGKRRRRCPGHFTLKGSIKRSIDAKGLKILSDFGFWNALTSFCHPGTRPWLLPLRSSSTALSPPILVSLDSGTWIAENCRRGGRRVRSQIQSGEPRPSASVQSLYFVYSNCYWSVFWSFESLNFEEAFIFTSLTSLTT